MKVLRVIASMEPSSGGPCQGIRNNIPALQELGIYNEVVCMDDPHADFMGEDDFPIYAVGPAHNPWAYGPKLKPWLTANLGRFDVVVVHGLWLYPGYAVYQAYKNIRGNKPNLFVMPHGMLDPYFQRAGNRKLKAIRNWLYWKWVEKKIIRQAKGILFTCEQELILARDTFRPYLPAQELNVGYGIPDPPSFTPDMSAKFLELCPEAKGKHYLLFLSRIHEKKGVDLLIKAYFQLQELYLREELPLLVIAGPGMATSYGRHLQDLVHQNPILGQSVFFPGMLSGEAKWGAFYGCDAFVLPSHQENFGIAVVEALACGKPVLISNQVNIWREIWDLNGGKIAPDSLIGTLDLLKGWIKLSQGEKTEMGQNSRFCFIKHFAITTNAMNFKDAIIHSLFFLMFAQQYV